jgi:hypothetical protein
MPIAPKSVGVAHTFTELVDNGARHVTNGDADRPSPGQQPNHDPQARPGSIEADIRRDTILGHRWYSS